MDALTDRRQRAREAYYDEPEFSIRHLDAAIEVATQVKITDDIIHAACQYATVADMTSAIKAAFRAAGFEVVE